MRRCPHCRRSFPERSRKCPLCGTTLLGVHRPPDRLRASPSLPRRSADGLVAICCCRSRWEADFVRTLLEAEGIAAAQRATPLTTPDSCFPTLASTIEILVRPEDEEDARAVILSGRQDVPGD